MNDLAHHPYVISSHLSRHCPKGRVMPSKLPLLLAIGVMVAATMLAACGYRAREAQFETDVTAHGVPESLLITWPNLGYEACASLKGGQTPRSWATYMAYYPDAIPIQQGLVLIYWAVKDVCPDQMSKGVEDFWKDAVYNWPTRANTEPSSLPGRTDVGSSN